MFNKKNFLAPAAIMFCLCFSLHTSVLAVEETLECPQCPDYAKVFLGEDKLENINRKVFAFNTALNKYAIRPVHIVWASVMPKYGMDRIQNAYTNIEYPKRLVSTLVERDFKATGKETLRFLTNSTLGLGGMYDPAKKFFNLEPMQEDMGQALAKCKVKQGPYMVVPVMSSATPRALAGKILECPLDPCLYFASPFTALVKMGLLVNKTSYMQPLAKMIETTYADPYDITKKLYGIESYIKNANLDRKEVLETAMKMFAPDEENKHENVESVTARPQEIVQEDEISEAIDNKFSAKTYSDNIVLDDIIPFGSNLKPDIILSGFNPQNPVVDAMRTAMFDMPEINESAWSELSVWNRCFAKKIKSDSVSVIPERDEYNYKYILQKDKNAPVAIIYPSVGEGANSHHSVVLAKMFYDEGYSVIMQGSHFHWEFVKSMPQGYKPGFPAKDAEYIQLISAKILNDLHKKHECNFSEKVIIGTSFGALETLFVAERETREPMLGADKYISINPPIELMYALKELDKNNSEWRKNPDAVKDKVALAAAKIIHLYQQRKDTKDFKLETLPFSEEEAKLITGFILHQKLSDLVFSIENVDKKCRTDFYERVNNLTFENYAYDYLLGETKMPFDELNFVTSLHSIANYLKENDNYKIYHTLDDYFVNRSQLSSLRDYAQDKLVLINNGSHLGYLYRKEFTNSLKKDIELKEEKVAVSMR